jgi:hypothetical protein
MMIHHHYALRRSSVATLITEQVGHFWKADPGHSSLAPKVQSTYVRDVAERRESFFVFLLHGFTDRYRYKTTNYKWHSDLTSQFCDPGTKKPLCTPHLRIIQIPKRR